MTPGIHPGLSRQRYDAIDGINHSVLKHCRRSTAHARHRQTNPPEQTEAQRLGSLLHVALLEPARFAQDFVQLPDLTQNLKTKNGETPRNPTATAEYKARLAEFGAAHMGRTFVSPEDMAVVRGIGEAIAAHPTAAMSIDPGAGEAEVAVVWIDPETGLACKALLDFHAACTVADLKTVDDASPGPFARLVAQNQWHQQAAFYLWGLSVLGRPARRFVHVAAEVRPPYGVAVYELDDAALDQGLRTNRAYLDCWSRCVQSGRWPAYADAVQPLSLPRYALTRDDE